MNYFSKNVNKYKIVSANVYQVRLIKNVCGCLAQIAYEREWKATIVKSLRFRLKSLLKINRFEFFTKENDRD